MIITILRQEYLALVDSKYRQRLRGSTVTLFQLFKWLSKDGSNAVQLTREEIRSLLIRSLLLGEVVLDATALMRHHIAIQEAVG